MTKAIEITPNLFVRHWPDRTEIGIRGTDETFDPGISTPLMSEDVRAMIEALTGDSKREAFDRLIKAMQKAVDLGIFPADVDQTTYLDNYEKLRQVLIAAGRLE